MYSLLSNTFYWSCRLPKCAGTDLVIFSSFWGAIWWLPRWSSRVLLSKALNLFFTESPRRGPQGFGKRQKCTPDVSKFMEVLYLEAESNSWIVLFVAFLGENCRRFQWFHSFSICIRLMVFKMNHGRSPDRVEKGCFACPEVLLLIA